MYKNDSSVADNFQECKGVSQVLTANITNSVEVLKNVTGITNLGLAALGGLE
jgi:hypothetical protein